MTNISQFSKYCGTTVTGQYRVTANMSVWSNTHNKMVQKVELSDHTGTCKACVRWEHREYAQNLPVQMVIEAQITPKCLNGSVIGGLIENWVVISPGMERNAASLIPVCTSPPDATTSILQLVQLVDGVQHDAIRRCYNHLIRNHYMVMLQAMGGWSYHHDYPGGLLVHTVGVMQKVKSMSEMVHCNNTVATELLMLAALIHDLGKGLNIMPGRTDVVYKSLRHEQLSLCMALPALVTLEQEWPEAASYLMPILNWLCTPPASRYPRQFPDAQLVQMSDTLDVIQDRALNHEQ